MGQVPARTVELFQQHGLIARKQSETQALPQKGHLRGRFRSNKASFC
jgi:hypothetical protein